MEKMLINLYARRLTRPLPQGFRAVWGRFRTVARNHTPSPGGKRRLCGSGSSCPVQGRRQGGTLYAIRGNRFVKAGKDKRRRTIGPCITQWRNRLGELPWTLKDSEKHSNQSVKDYPDELRDVLQVNRHQQKGQRQSLSVVSVLSGATVVVSKMDISKSLEDRVYTVV